MTEAKRKICDYLLISCYTGLTFSEIQDITLENFESVDGLTWFIKSPGMQSSQLRIPVSAKTLEILNSHNGKMPPPISIQKTNKFLKQICMKAGLDENIDFGDSAGKTGQKREIKKYELVSSQTGRKSFAINSFAEGIPVPKIMEITGHKTERAFMQFIDPQLHD